MRARIDRTQGIVDQAVREIAQSSATYGQGGIGGADGGGGAGAPGGRSIQDGEGRLLIMCGVSVCGGADVCGE